MRTFCILLMAAVALPAQTLDTAILGSVSDPSGASVSGAQVAVTHPATGQTRSVTTGADGHYEVRYLLPGEYTVEVKAQGFRAERRTGLVIQINQQARIDFALQVGEVLQTLEVQATAPLLQTENATLGEVVARERIVNLPLNGRNFLQLSTLTPGVVVREESNGERTRVIANGARDIWMQVNINGVTAVNNRANFVNFYPSIDALEEFKVQSGNYSAEYGGNAGANINMQLRSGTNKLHGSLFEFLRNDNLDARGYFRPRPLPKDILGRNQFGAVVSGPVRRDKTFFLLGYEAMRAKKETAGTAVVLTPAMRQGDFSAVSGNVTDPLAGGARFSNNIIPASRLNPVSVNLVNNYMPLPNVAGAVNYAGVQRDDLIVDQGLTRIDHSFGASDQVFFHYIYSRRDFPNRQLNPFFFHKDNTFPNTSLGFQHVHTFRPSLINEARFGWHRGNIARLNPRTNTDFRIESLGIQGLRVGGPDGRALRPDEQGIPVLNITGFLGMGDSASSSNIDNSRTYQFVDNVSWIRGAHSLKMGGDIRNHRDDATTNNWPFGNMAFTGDIAGNAAAAYMLGFPRTTLTPEGVPISKVRQWRYGVYFQDDWKASPNLTLNLGLRYDLFALPDEINAVSRTLRFDLGPAPVLWPEPGQRADLWLNEYHYVSPRFGFAWRAPFRTVVRGGYGIFYTAAQFDNVNILQLNLPAGGSLTIINPALNPVATIQNPVPRELFPRNPIFNVVTLPPDRKRRNAYLQNWNLQVSRELTANDVLEVGWVGSKGTFVDTSLQNFNQPPPGPGDIQARRSIQGFARVRMIVADTNTIYHSFQTRYEHRFSRGLSLTGAYTWSHLIDDAGQTINRGGCVCQDPRNRGRAERADSIFDIRHRFVGGWVWDLPLASGLQGPSRYLLHGWQFGGILTLSAGAPFNVTQSGDTHNNDGLWPRPNAVAGRSPKLSNATPDRWFDTDAFTRSTTYGTSPRNPVVGPGLAAFDLSVSKSFRMPYAESHDLLFRTEFFNAFNTPQFGNPGSALGTGTFGRVTGVQLDNRQIQMALKYTF
jgi:outer membrane receptor protein involved in Fe transport